MQWLTRPVALPGLGGLWHRDNDYLNSRLAVLSYPKTFSGGRFERRFGRECAPDSLAPDSFLHILSVGNIPALVTGSTALLVCVSAVYMTAYFYIVGPQFQGFLSPSDYIVGSINWLPALFLAAVYGIGSRPLYLLFSGIFKPNSDANFGQTVPASDFKRGISIKVILVWLAINSLGLVLNLPIIRRDQLPMFISKLIFWNMVLVVPFVVFDILDGIIPKKFAPLVVISIIMIAWVASSGISNAVNNIDIDINPLSADPPGCPMRALRQSTISLCMLALTAATIRRFRS